jgi:hypothetical protein
MTKANDFTQAAQQIGQLANRITPPETDKYAQARKLAVFHLRSAARQLRDIAEAMAKTEPPNAA